MKVFPLSVYFHDLFALPKQVTRQNPLSSFSVSSAQNFMTPAQKQCLMNGHVRIPQILDFISNAFPNQQRPPVSLFLKDLNRILESNPATQAIAKPFWTRVKQDFCQFNDPHRHRRLIRTIIHALLRYAPLTIPTLRKWLNRYRRFGRLSSIPDILTAFLKWAENQYHLPFLDSTRDFMNVLRYVAATVPSLLMDAANLLPDLIEALATPSAPERVKRLRNWYVRGLRGDFGIVPQGYLMLLDVLLFHGDNALALPFNRIPFLPLLRSLPPNPERETHSTLLTFLITLRRSPVQLYQAYRTGRLQPHDSVESAARNPEERHRWIQLLTRTLPHALRRTADEVTLDGTGFHAFYFLYLVSSIWLDAWLHDSTSGLTREPNTQRAFQNARKQLDETFRSTWLRLDEPARAKLGRFIEEEWHKRMAVFTTRQLQQLR